MASYTAARPTVDGEPEKKILAEGNYGDSSPPLERLDVESLTDEERRSLRHVADRIPWNAYLIAFVELAERFSYYGSVAVYVNFIQQPLPDGRNGSNSKTGAGGLHGQSGALGMGQRASTGLTTFNQFWVYVVPLFGAYIADTRWGRYKTICVAVAVALVGHILLTVSAIPSVINHPHGSLACFVVALVIMGVGTGGFKANISPLVAEQYQPSKPFIETCKSGERVVVDPRLTTERIYMYFYLFTNVGALLGRIGMTYAEKFVGYWLSFFLPTMVFLLCPLVLYVGRERYKTAPPTGSVLAKALRLWRFAAAGGFTHQSKWSISPVRTIKNMTSKNFWEDVKPSRAAADSRPAWMTFDDEWVDEVKRGFKACTVFCWYPIYWLAYNQLNGNLTSQAATMQTHGIPNDVLSNLDPLSLIIFIPICDRLIYPTLRRRLGINFTPLKRITCGFFAGSAGMVWAAVVQHRIYATSPCGSHAASCVDSAGHPIVAPLNVWLQSGSYILVAFSEILASITGLEYAFTKAPRNMRSLVMAVYLFAQALSAAVGEAFVSLSSDPLLVWNYGVMAVLAAVTGAIFWLAHRRLDAQEDRLNDLVPSEKAS